MGRRKTQWDESAYKNNRSYMYYYNRLMELSISRFEWLNIPDSVDPRYLELALYELGQCLFFNDDVMGYLVAKSSNGSTLDVYNVPSMRCAYAANGYYNELNEDNSVIIYNNMLRTPTMYDIEMFAKRLYDFDSVIDVNVNAQKTPVLIQCTESQRLTMQNLYMQYTGNYPFIMGSKDLDINGFKALKTDAPFIAPNLYELKTQIWNEALGYLGISSVNNVKKERLITDEVQRNLGATVASRNSALNMRKEACNKINKMFGLNIDVQFRPDYMIIDNEESEVDDNEPLDNRG